MRRTSILLDPGLLAELERIGRRQGRPTAHVIREALERYVTEQGEEPSTLPGFVGLGHGPGDVAKHADEHAATELPAQLDRERGQ
jgi:hypothetical protein